MVNPMLYKYSVVVVTSKGKQEDITSLLSELTWEEEEGQLPIRISLTAKNDVTSKGRLSQIAKPGCWIGVLYSYNGGNAKEVCRGKIVDWNPSQKGAESNFAIKAYDCLYDLNESQDNVYYSRGKRTKTLITKILKKWKVKVSSYNGPNVKHSKVVYKSEKLGTVILKILNDARKKGGKDAILRSDGVSVKVISYGRNKTVYHFDESSNITEIRHTISTAGMVTRVKVTGQQKKSGKVPVKATVNGKTKYGIRQKLVSKSKNEKLKTAKKEAKGIISDEGNPKETIQISAPDMPVVRKGDVIHVHTSTIKEDFYYVVGGSHNASTAAMTLTLTKTSKKKGIDGAENLFRVGTIVTFTGTKQYLSSKKKAKSRKVKGTGRAKITKFKGGASHPYYLVTRNAKKCNVKGWVNENSFS